MFRICQISRIPLFKSYQYSTSFSLYSHIYKRTVINCLSPIRSIYSSNSASNKPDSGIESSHFKVFEFYPKGEYIKKQVSIPSLMKEYDLHVRDILAIHPSSSRTTPCILPRTKAILVHLDILRAIITSNCMLLFEVDNPVIDKMAIDISDYHKNENEKFGNTFPFELQSLEGLLIVASDNCYTRLESYKVIAERLVIEAENVDSNFESYHELHPIRNHLSQLDTVSSEIARCIQDMLDNDEDMLELLLTEKEKRHSLPPHEMHLPVELLLESYFRKFIDISNVTRSYLQDVIYTQEMATINLDNYRNHLLTVDLRLSIAQLAISTGAFVGSLFGMNLLSGLELNPYAFYITSASIWLITGSIYITTLFKVNIFKKSTSQFEKELKFMQMLFKDVKHFDVSYMEYINTGNIFENERITSNDFIRITENIIKRELTAEEIHQLLNIVKSNDQGYINKNDIIAKLSRYATKK